MSRHLNRAQVFSCNRERLKSIGIREAEEMVESGEAIRISKLKAPQLKIRLKHPRSPDRLLAQASITFSEMRANAGEFGGRRRSKKRHRLGNFVDRAKTKLEIWPSVGDTKAVRVGPVSVGLRSHDKTFYTLNGSYTVTKRVGGLADGAQRPA